MTPRRLECKFVFRRMTGRMRERAWFAMVLLALVSASCRAENPASRAAPIHTDRARYVLRPGPYGPEATIVATFTAPQDTAVYILHCNGAISWGLQQRVNDRWMDAWGAMTNGCLSAPIVVPG